MSIRGNVYEFFEDIQVQQRARGYARFLGTYKYNKEREGMRVLQGHTGTTKNERV